MILSNVSIACSAVAGVHVCLHFRDGYTEAQIIAVSARYDIDVDHGVSRAELRKMQADLGRQKVSCQCLHAQNVFWFFPFSALYIYSWLWWFG